MARETIRSPGKAYTEVDTEEKKRGGGKIRNNYAASVSYTSVGGTFP